MQISFDQFLLFEQRHNIPNMEEHSFNKQFWRIISRRPFVLLVIAVQSRIKITLSWKSMKRIDNSFWRVRKDKPLHLIALCRRLKLLNVEVKLGLIFDKFVSQSKVVYLLAILKEVLSIKQVIPKVEHFTDFLPVFLFDLRHYICFRHQTPAFPEVLVLADNVPYI
jgi:hypothetical protein